MGAVYQSSSGRAHATAYVSRSKGKPPVVYVDTWCDSLARLVAYYQSREEHNATASATAQQQHASVQTSKEHPPNTVLIAFLAFTAGAIITGTVITILKKKKHGDR